MVVVLPPKRPSPLAQLFTGFGTGLMNQYQQNKLSDILGDASYGDNSSAKLFALLGAPVSPQFKQMAIQTFLAKQQLDRQQQQMGMSQERLDIERERLDIAKGRTGLSAASLLQDIPRDMPPDQLFLYLLKNNIPPSQAKTIVENIAGEKIPKQFTEQESRLEKNFKNDMASYKREVEKKNMFGFSEPDFTGERGEKILGQMNKRLKRYYNDQIKLRNRFNQPLTPDLERYNEDPEFFINSNFGELVPKKTEDLSDDEIDKILNESFKNVNRRK